MMNNSFENKIKFSRAGKEAYLKQFGERRKIKTVYGDATVLKTIIRSNPGFFLLRNGTVRGKWHHNSFPDAKEILKKVNITI